MGLSTGRGGRGGQRGVRSGGSAAHALGLGGDGGNRNSGLATQRAGDAIKGKRGCAIEQSQIVGSFDSARTHRKARTFKQLTIFDCPLC